MTTLIVIEPHPLQRLGLQRLLADVTPSCIINAEDYSVLENEPSTTECDLVLLSICSFEDIQKLAIATERIYSPKAILLLSESNDIPDTVQGLPATVAGYIPKNTCPAVLQASVLLVLAGGRCFPARSNSSSTQPSVFAQLKPPKWPLENKPKTGKTNDGAAHSESEMLGLTPRQYEVLVLLARGFPVKEVARHLNISAATAKAHTETLYQRLDVHNRNAAVYEAFARGASLGWTKADPSADEQAR